jgi:plastocyanin
MKLTILLPITVAAVLAIGGSAAADTSQLTGVVGPGFNISLQDGSGARVTTLAPGTYTLTVQDKSNIHNFHLAGPGVDVATDIDFVGTQTFTVTLANGTYRYDCDAHATTMKGSFTVGAAQTTTTTATKPAPKKHKAKHKPAKKKKKR